MVERVSFGVIADAKGSFEFDEEDYISSGSDEKYFKDSVINGDKASE